MDDDSVESFRGYGVSPRLKEARAWLELIVKNTKGKPAEHAKELLAYTKPVEIEADHELWVDTAIPRPGLFAATLGMTEKDAENVRTVASAMKGVRNYGVAIRRLISREAKRVREERKKNPPAEQIEGQTTIEDMGA